jgi:hypothetical protein
VGGSWLGVGKSFQTGVVGIKGLFLLPKQEERLVLPTG